MENTVKQRLIDYLAFKKIGQNRFEKMAGVSNGYIHNLKNAPKTPILTKILQAAPDLNRVWLLTGEGEMLTTSPASIPGVVRASELSESPPMEPGPARPRMLPEVDFEFAAGIEMPITSHVGRRTAGSIWLNSGIPIDVVAKCLGHQSIQVTQRAYAKILDTTVVEAFRRAKT